MLWASCILAHPFHTSNAEVAWSDDQRALEIALRLIPEDLEQALSWRAGKPVILQQPGVEALVLDYLQSSFLVSEGGRPLAATWVGMEVEYEAAWIYFTIAANPGHELVLRNTLLIEVNEQQVNRVSPLWPGATVMVFNADTAEQGLWRPSRR